MEIRTITAAEVDGFATLNAYAFHWDESTRERVHATIRANEVWGAFLDGGLAAGAWVIPLTSWMQGREIPMAGVAAVAVAPEHRGRGIVRGLLTRILQEMKRTGMATSTLYPSTYTLYRKFGWELGAEDRAYTFHPGDLAWALGRGEGGGFGQGGSGSMRRCTLADVGTLDQVYQAYARPRNGWVMRTPEWWQRRVLRLLKGGMHAFLWLNGHGAPRGYLVYSLSGEDILKQSMTIREWVALDTEAFAGTAAFIAGHNTVALVRWTAPAGDTLLTQLADPRIDAKILPRHMFRVVDVQAALALRPYPVQCRGTLRLTIGDEAAPWNHGSFDLQLEGGAARIAPSGQRPHAGGAQPAGELACDVGTLSQIYCGYLSPLEASALGKLRADRPEALALAEEAFAALPPHMSDYF